jgi:hypothetical protein
MHHIVIDDTVERQVTICIAFSRKNPFQAKGRVLGPTLLLTCSKFSLQATASYQYLRIVLLCLLKGGRTAFHFRLISIGIGGEAFGEQLEL